EAFGETMSEYIGLMHQGAYLFRTTILNNIRISREEASEAEVWAVLEKVRLKEKVNQLPEGLQTMLDEAGLRFSGSERHGLAL
ncbi:thiol reductant ABC exporter subunit CydC, partial [Enterococcus faecalis]